MGYRRILVPVDGSSTSARGVAEAIKLAHDARAKLMLLHVVEEYAILGIPEAGAMPAWTRTPGIRCRGRVSTLRMVENPITALSTTERQVVS